MTEKYDYCSSVPSWGLLSGIVALEWKERAPIEKVNSRYFWWFLAAILAVHQYGVSIQSSTKVCRTSSSKWLRKCGLQRPETWTNWLYISLLYHFIFLASSTGQFCLIICVRKLSIKSTTQIWVVMCY